MENEISEDAHKVVNAKMDEMIKKMQDDRERFMKAKLREKLKLHDRFLFFFYQKLADYFGGGNRVVTIQRRGSFEDTQFGIKIYGENYWMVDSALKKDICPDFYSLSATCHTCGAMCLTSYVKGEIKYYPANEKEKAADGEHYCPTCKTVCTVASNDEGTNYYVPKTNHCE